MRAALRLGSSPSSPLTAAAAPLMRASQWITATGTVSPEIGKFSTALAVSPPHSCLSWHRFSLSCARMCVVASWATQTLPAEGRQLARQPDRVVVGHQEARALRARAAARRAAARAPLRPARADAGGRGRPTAAAPACPAAGRGRAARAARRAASAARTSPTSARGSSCRARRRRRGARGRRRPGCARAERRTPRARREHDARAA